MGTTSLCVHTMKKKKEFKTSIRTWSKTKKGHKSIAFYKEAWLKPYIEMNTELRKRAKNDFDKNLSNLLNNAMYGKSLQNVHRHRDIKLVTDMKKDSN